MFQSYLIETLIEDEKTQDELSELVNMENTAIGRYIERKEREIEEKWEEKGKVIEQQWKNKENEQQQKWKNKENEQQQKWKIKEAELKENQKKNLFESARKMLLDNIPDNKIVKYLSIQEDDLVKIKLDIAAK
jgi:flagellar biosynthesis GTPase FlhF